MNYRNYLILKLLNSQDNWISAFAISTFLNSSVRNIKTGIKEINSENPNLILSSNKGFKINDYNQSYEILVSNSSKYNYSNNRIPYILRKLLLTNDKFDIFSLSEELHVSDSTIQSDLSKINEILDTFNLKLKQNQWILSVSGKEIDKRKLINYLINKDIDNNFLNIKKIQLFFPELNISFIYKIIKYSLKLNELYIDEISLLNLVVIMAIILERRKLDEKNKASNIKYISNKSFSNIYFFIKTQIYENFNIKLDNKEMEYFAAFLETRISSKNSNIVKDYSDENNTALFDELQKSLYKTFGIKIKDVEFFSKFIIHINNLIIRSKNNIKMHNPNHSFIKNQHPFIYEVAVFVANLINLKENVEINENEISYIAIYLGLMLEENQNIGRKAKVILLDSGYLNNSSEIIENIKEVFSDSIMSIEVHRNTENLPNHNNYDLLISTVSLDLWPPILHVQITNRLNTKDIGLIANKLNEFNSIKIQKSIKDRIGILFRENLFFTDTNIKNQNDSINLLADNLIDNNYVTPDFKNKIFEREQISSSAYQNIAIPHPLSMESHESVVAVGLHPNGIDWFGKKINIVFMLALKNEDRMIFKDIFDFITEIISKEENLKKVVEAKSYSNFVSTLYDLSIK